jgi:hypothetical protein
MTSTSVEKHWYREPWPWILMAGPFMVVVAAIFSAWLAISSSDGLVTDDYYKKGLAVNETLTQSALARSLGIQAKLGFTEESVRVHLGGRVEAGFSAPTSVRITLSHPTRAGVDQVALLSRQGDAYVGKLNLPSSGHWLVLLEDEAKSWRLMASVMLPSSGDIVIGGEVPADIRN